jgi:hypothetical protein
MQQKKAKIHYFVNDAISFHSIAPPPGGMGDENHAESVNSERSS